MPMQEVTPKVVAMAVSTVITMLRIFPQMLLFSILISVFMIDDVCRDAACSTTVPKNN